MCWLTLESSLASTYHIIVINTMICLFYDRLSGEITMDLVSIAYLRLRHISLMKMEICVLPSEETFSAEALSPTKCTLTVPWFLKASEIDKLVTSKLPRLSISTFISLPSFLASFLSTFERSKSRPPTYPLNDML